MGVQCSGKVFTCHIRHGLVDDNEIKPIGVILKNFKGFQWHKNCITKLQKSTERRNNMARTKN